MEYRSPGDFWGALMFGGGEFVVWIPGGVRPTGIPLRGLARVTQARSGWRSIRVAMASGAIVRLWFRVPFMFGGGVACAPPASRSAGLPV